MVNNRFVLYQVKRELKRNGTVMKFYRPGKNEFGEPTDLKLFCTLKGIYHEHAPHMLDTYRHIMAFTDASYRTEKTPQLLVLYKDFYFKNDPNDTEFQCVDVGDIVISNGRKLSVTGVLNVQEWNMLMDISFEEVDEGGNTGNPNI